MACDGIWEKKSHKDIISWIQSKMKEKLSKEAIVELLLDETVAKEKNYDEYEGNDNMTGILIEIDPKEK